MRLRSANLVCGVGFVLLAFVYTHEAATHQLAASTPKPCSNPIRCQKPTSKAQHKSIEHMIASSVNTHTNGNGAPSEVVGVLGGLLPVAPSELLKFLTMSSLMFWIVYVFTMTRDTKDTLIVTNCGAEAIAFLKVYGVVPAAAAFMIAYSRLSNILNKKALFYVTIIPFFAFYAVFAFVLYPMRDTLHWTSLATEGRLSYILNLAKYWTFSLYYIVSELWGSAGIPLLFWQCANDVTPIHQAKRFYPLLSLLGNLGPIASGQTMTFVSRLVSRDRSVDPDVAFQRGLQILTTAMLGAGGLIMCLYWYVCKLREIELRIHAEELPKSNSKKSKPSKPKMSLKESLYVLSKSKYLGNIAILVLSYGLTMEFTEIMWKATVKLAYPLKADYMTFMGNYSTMIGCTAFLMMLTGSQIISRLGWKAGALMTPAMTALLSLPFFAYISLYDLKVSRKALMTAVYIGTLQNILTKATKYSIFDPTKEMTYIPLDADSKVTGKAAIDVLGARLGKSGGALTQQGLVMIFGNILNCAPVIGCCFYAVMFAWFSAVTSLNKMFHEKSQEHDELMQASMDG